jgi:hypothetical protein
MSYSVCYHCGAMVYFYDKYCKSCRDKFNLPDLPEYQKGRAYPNEDERLSEFNADETKGSH